MDPKTDINGKVNGFKKGRMVDLNYILIGFSKDSMKLKLSEEPEHYSFRLRLENQIQTTKLELTQIATRYQTINIYKKELLLILI